MTDLQTVVLTRWVLHAHTHLT